MQDAGFHAMPPESQRLQSLRQLTLVLYLLYGIGMFTGIPALIAVIINHVKYSDTVDTLYASHFRWQMRSFWWSLVWAVLGFLTVWIGVGFVILGLNWCWLVYRLVRGFLSWNDGRRLPV